MRVRILAAVLKPWASFFTLHCPSSLSCLNEYLTIDSGANVYEQPSRINCSIWLDASQRNRDGVCVNRSEDRILRCIRTCLCLLPLMECVNRHFNIMNSMTLYVKMYTNSLISSVVEYLLVVKSGGRAVERWTVNRCSIPTTAVSKLRQFRSPHTAYVFRKRH